VNTLKRLGTAARNRQKSPPIRHGIAKRYCPQEVLAAHRRLAADFGNQPDAVVRVARERAERLAPRTNSAQRANEAVTFARDKNFEREAVVDERLLVRDSLRRGMGEIRYIEIRDTLERRLTSGEFVSVQRSAHQTGRLLTTVKTIAAEREIVRQMRHGQNQVQPVMSRQQAIIAVDRHPHLNAGQKATIEDVLSSSDRIQGIQGVAGAGKTTTLEVIRAAATGYPDCLDPTYWQTTNCGRPHNLPFETAGLKHLAGYIVHEQQCLVLTRVNWRKLQRCCADVVGRQRSLEAALGKGNVVVQSPVMIAEDYSVFVEQGVPSFYFTLGVADPEKL